MAILVRYPRCRCSSPFPRKVSSLPLLQSLFLPPSLATASTCPPYLIRRTIVFRYVALGAEAGEEGVSVYSWDALEEFDCLGALQIWAHGEYQKVTTGTKPF